MLSGFDLAKEDIKSYFKQPAMEQYYDVISIKESIEKSGVYVVLVKLKNPARAQHSGGDHATYLYDPKAYTKLNYGHYALTKDKAIEDFNLR